MDFQYNDKSKLNAAFDGAEYFNLSKKILDSRKPKVNLDLFASITAKNLANSLELSIDNKKTNEHYHNNQVYGFYIHPTISSGSIPSIMFKSAIKVLRDGLLLPLEIEKATPNNDPLILEINIIGFVDEKATELMMQIYSLEYSSESSMITIKLTKPESKYLATKKQIAISKHYVSDEDYECTTEQAASWILSTINENL
ncbi:TPA: hypothetical protein U2I44_000750 [Providencia rettgeri]|nr:hypothetical protein [Providencia rettgeri]